MKLFVFGSTGDLVKRKVFPALQNLDLNDLDIYALGRQNITKEIYSDNVCEGGKCTLEFKNKIKYHKINFENEDICEGGCTNLFDFDKINYIYISLPPSLIEKVLLSISKLKELGFDMKILIEKPFGENSIAAKRLKKIIEENNLIDDIFLSDHYLFKELETDFKADFKTIKIASFENVGLEGRTGYYDSVGALNDMVQSHFMNFVFNRLEDVEEEFNEFNVLDFKRGQYVGYIEELGKNSDTETFVYLKFKTKNKEFEFITGKSFQKKELYLEVDGNRLDVDSKGDYQKLFEEFFNHKWETFANLNHSIFSWELIESLALGSGDLFYYEKESSFEDIKRLITKLNK